MLLLILACQSPKLSDDSAPESQPPGDDSRVESPADDSPPDSPPADDTGPNPCADRCDDGLDCTEDRCDAQDRCVHAPLEDCAWPASVPPDVLALAELDPEFERSLSGATWNPHTRALWVVRGDGATAWSLVEDGAGSWQIDDKASLGDLDVESVTLADPAGDPTTLHILLEHDEQVALFDLSTPGQATQTRLWDTSTHLSTSGTRGSEGLAFIPDDFLLEWGFTDPDGAPRQSALGYGGLFFVGTQNGGSLHVFDLSASDDSFEYVGEFETARSDTSALEFDASTGRLYIWHGGEDNDLEIARLSSTPEGSGRRMDTEAIFHFPQSTNVEGLALMGTEDCVNGLRTLFFTIDDGDERALDVYTDWPLCGP